MCRDSPATALLYGTHRSSLKDIIRRRVQSGTLDLEDALRLFDELLQQRRHRASPGSIQPFNDLITAVARGRGDGPARIVSLFSRMARAGAAVPNAYTYGVLVSCCCRAGRVDLALSPLTAVLKAGLTLEAIAFTPLLSGLCGERRVEEAMDVVRRVMPDLRCAPDVFSHSVILKGLCDHGRSLEALKFLHMMIRAGDEINVVSYTTVIDGLLKDGKVEDAVKLFDEMRDQGVTPDVVTYGSIIDKLCKVGAMDKAYGVLRRMVYEGIVPDCHVYNCFINGYSTSGQWKKAVMIFEEMRRKGIKPNVVTYSSVMGALCKHGKCSDARKVFDFMVNSGETPNVTSYSILLQGYALHGSLADVQNLFDTMIGLGIAPDRHALSILLHAYAVREMAKEAMLVLSDMQKQGVNPDVVHYGIGAGAGQGGDRRLNGNGVRMWWPATAVRSLSGCARLGHGCSHRRALRQILAGAWQLLRPHLSATGCGGSHPDDSSSQRQQGCAMHRRSRQSSSISSSNIHVFAAEGADELNLGFMRGWLFDL
ncbi:hypothetical protein QOZ80_2BG0166610 [Eleusine coracana subsp. coracana]|nr:hypothetical protein QOZ80_2BG0166610 [Eleusine coracana subsp. coracana]